MNTPGKRLSLGMAAALCLLTVLAADSVTFKPVSTTGMHLEVTLRPNWSAGIQEWKVK
jgi:hypothetical protein